MKKDLYLVATRLRLNKEYALATKSQPTSRAITELFDSLHLSQEETDSFHYVRKERNKVIHQTVPLANRDYLHNHVIKL